MRFGYWTSRRIITGSRTMFASQMDFRKGQTSKKAPPKRGCQVGGTPSKKDHYSLAESSKYVQIEVAFIPRTTNIECSRGDQRIQQSRAVPKRDDSSPFLPPHHQGYHPGRHPRPSFECLSLCVSLAQREFGLPGRDCRTTKIRKRDARGDRGKWRKNSSLRENCRCSVGAKSRN
jgi:hypothetical protein